MHTVAVTFLFTLWNLVYVPFFLLQEATKFKQNELFYCMDFLSKFYFVTTDIYISLREFTGSTRWNNARNINPPKILSLKPAVP